MKQVHLAKQTHWHICHKAPHITNQSITHSCWFHCQLPCKGTQMQTNPQWFSCSKSCALPAWLSTAAHEWSTIPVWLAPWHNHAPHTKKHFTHYSTTNWHHMGTLQYMQPNPIYYRVMHLKPIDAEYNLTQEVLAHITLHRQLHTTVPHAGSKEFHYTHHNITLEASAICHGDS